LAGFHKYSGYTFSHYDLPFPTRYCIPYVKSGLHQLVINSWVRAPLRSRSYLVSHCIRSFVLSAWTPRFVSLAHRPRWLFLPIRILL